MNMPFYVSPEQLMKDRADFARKGIARGRSVVVLAYDAGIAFATENPSRALHKISEIYDRIGFAAVGKYNEFENLRVAGVRYADLRGYTYDRSDVTARGLANAYAQILGTVFITESKPLEVELVVAEVGRTAEDDQIYRLTYDGTVADEHGHVVMGGQAEQLGRKVGEGWRPDMSLGEALRLAVTVLGSSENGTPRTIEPGQLEVAVLERSRPRRAFRRLTKQSLTELLTEEAAEDSGADDAEGPGGTAVPRAVPAAPEKDEPAAPEKDDPADQAGTADPEPGDEGPGKPPPSGTQEGAPQD
ncbi:proteasome subunit alpha [Myceligenerans xiligouense]|uniref:Proteasome subunit alpha n=1 Tax=Myceligenerans xiligouense TaxID=253184 RepID=A0A3N4YKA8_9MICO|nr:proteasome subunit alpha [Myceligenerans xiligouense]RPF21173.1 proteasome alpha subunit [Myceligenerans xiligouense]